MTHSRCWGPRVEGHVLDYWGSCSYGQMWATSRRCVNERPENWKNEPEEERALMQTKGNQKTMRYLNQRET